MSTASSPRLVPCPTCGTPAPFVAANRWRPFCSERCRSVDLGAWASEQFRVAESPADATEDPAPDLPSEPGPRSGQH